MPSRGLSVLRATASPPGIEISTSMSVAPPSDEAASATASRIILRGAGLIAGSPGGIGSPARVTVPTPTPARKTMPPPAGPGRTVETISRPLVTSGSSPASLTTPARAPSAVWSWQASAKATRAPRGNRMSIGSGNSPVIQPIKAALVAAVAQAPVVQPRRSSPALPLFGAPNCARRDSASVTAEAHRNRLALYSGSTGLPAPAGSQCSSARPIASPKRRLASKVSPYLR